MTTPLPATTAQGPQPPLSGSIQPPEPLEAPAQRQWDDSLNEFAQNLWTDVCEAESAVNGAPQGRNREVTSGMVRDAYAARTDRRPQPVPPRTTRQRVLRASRAGLIAVASIVAGYFVNHTDKAYGVVGLVICACIAVFLVSAEAFEK
jgi:hypothetical protein